LIAEDSEEDALLLVEGLKRAGYELQSATVDSRSAMETELDRQPWDLLVSDHSMPQFDAVAAIEVLKRRGIDVPVIIFSGTIDTASAVVAMKAGARDFIRKDDFLRLVPAIERELKEAEDRRARREAEARALQAQKMELVGRLAAGIAHDFNNFLTVISAACSVLAKDLSPEDPRAREVSEIREITKHASSLTRQLLIFSRRHELCLKPLCLQDAVRGMEGLLRRLIGKGVEFQISLHVPSSWIRADVAHLEQLLMNLCVNANDAMPQGGRLELRTSNTIVEGRPCALISVRDTGVGMDPATLSKIFEPFFTTKPVGRGTGLGLATSHSIVQQLGGKISVESAPGRGTTFYVSIPVVDPPKPT